MHIDAMTVFTGREIDGKMPASGPSAARQASPYSCERDSDASIGTRVTVTQLSITVDFATPLVFSVFSLVLTKP